MDKKNIIIALLALSLTALLVRAWYVRDHSQIMAVTGATPLAVDLDVPRDFSLTITGMVKKDYRFKARALDAFAKTRVRTREVNPSGAYEGAYAYLGVPLYNILEGVAPKKAESAAFDRPLDMVVTAVSSTGRTSRFSYGEITMTDDRHPLTLAYDRQQVLPTKDPEKYEVNIHRDNLRGLRLVCPRDRDTGRYLDDVVELRLELLPAPDRLLPAMTKGKDCRASSLTCVVDEKVTTARLDGIPLRSLSGWVRIGHGRGYKGISSMTGISLKDFLRKNFPQCGEKDFFLFVACDGYRCLFSGREVFSGPDGDSMLLTRDIDGKKRDDYMLAPVDDFFVDRDIWGLSHIALIRAD
jgi:hypothetical protein